jgi:hypothetical protein
MMDSSCDIFPLETRPVKPYHQKSGRLNMIRDIHCGYCGESVSQISCKKKTGKWFHSSCLREFKNFNTSLYRIDDVENYKPQQLIDLLKFRDVILFHMIMRKDLRLMKQQWSLLLKNKAVPLVISPKQ